MSLVSRKLNLFVATGALLLGLGVGSYLQAEAQPHMRAALESLRAAKQSLMKAEHDKGGHRAKALELVNAAIAEVEQGVRFDNQH